jgi:hypothetical protein
MSFAIEPEPQRFGAKAIAQDSTSSGGRRPMNSHRLRVDAFLVFTPVESKHDSFGPSIFVEAAPLPHPRMDVKDPFKECHNVLF